MASICLNCIGDIPLRERLKGKSRARKCSYCGIRRRGIVIEQLAKFVDELLRVFIQIGESYPVANPNSDNPAYEQRGDSLENLLESELEVPYEAAHELAETLIDQDSAYPPDGDEPFYDDTQLYHRLQVPSWEYAQGWQDFSLRIKHERRFFDDEGRQRLSQILGEPGSDRAAELPILEIGPNTRAEIVFRARRTQSEIEALEIVKNPETELGPPHPHKAIAGRMNAAGIQVFYGALSEDTALAEVRPSVGSVVVVGKFRPLRRLRLLDLSQIGIGFTGSIFAVEYGDRAARRAFLEGFHGLIARPIEPHHEPLEYIPTQAVAEYVANVLLLDGIMYASAQVGAVPDAPESSSYAHLRELDDGELAQHNVVLFGEAARVVRSNQGQQGADSSSRGTLKVEPTVVNARRVLSVRYGHEWHYLHNPSTASALQPDLAGPFDF